MARRKVVYQFVVEVMHGNEEMAEQHAEALRDVLTQFVRVSPPLLGGVTRISPRVLRRLQRRTRPADKTIIRSIKTELQQEAADG